MENSHENYFASLYRDEIKIFLEKAKEKAKESDSEYLPYSELKKIFNEIFGEEFLAKNTPYGRIRNMLKENENSRAVLVEKNFSISRGREENYYYIFISRKNLIKIFYKRIPKNCEKIIDYCNQWDNKI